MEVTTDNYELPKAVADNARELSELTGATINNIRSTACRLDKGIIKTGRFHRIELDEEGE